jgi:hypothetical protein
MGLKITQTIEIRRVETAIEHSRVNGDKDKMRSSSRDSGRCPQARNALHKRVEFALAESNYHPDGGRSEFCEIRRRSSSIWS